MTTDRLYRYHHRSWNAWWPFHMFLLSFLRELPVGTWLGYISGLNTLFHTTAALFLNLTLVATATHPPHVLKCVHVAQLQSVPWRAVITWPFYARKCHVTKFEGIGWWVCNIHFDWSKSHITRCRLGSNRFRLETGRRKKSSQRTNSTSEKWLMNPWWELYPNFIIPICHLHQTG